MAQDPPPTGPFSVIVADWARALDSVQRYVDDGDYSADRSNAYRGLADKIGDEASAIELDADKVLATTTTLLDALGPPPTVGEPPETEAVVSQRAELVHDAARLRARVSLSSLAATRAAQLKDAITASHRQTIADRLLMRQPTPLTPASFMATIPNLLDHLSKLLYSPFEWYGSLTPERRDRLELERFLVVALIAAFIGWLIRFILLRRLGRDPAIAEPTYRRKLVASVAEGSARGIVPALILAAVLYQSRQPSVMFTGMFGQVFESLCIALILFVLAAALTHAALAPDLPAWRLTPLKAESARLLTQRIVLLAAITAIDRFLQLSADSMRTAGDLTPFYEFVTNSAEAMCLLLLTPGRLWRFEAKDGPPATDDDETGPDTEPSASWRFTRRLVGASAIGGIIAIGIGYADLGNFIVKTLLLCGTIFGALYLFRGLLRELVGMFMRSSFMREEMAVRHIARQALKFWLRVGLDALLGIVGVYTVAFWWGASFNNLVQWTIDVLTGVTIGSVTISIVDILLAAALFIGILMTVRLVQRALTEKVLPQTTMHPSVQHSVSTALGYGGLTIAATVGFTALGFDLTNIALIAGALSVGIGFGLQNVVNNFVSGIILLVERPIKVGDWISVSGHEGFVRKINVRAIEMQTFQRAAVIIPNSELLSTPVINWTHKDRLGRIEIKVGVAYGSDTEKVRDLLLDCAKAQDGLIAHPEPFVLFQDFGASSLDFELRGFLRDVEQVYRVGSELRFAIDKAFREAGIEIPFLQTDIHLRDMDRLEAALAGRAGPAADAKT